MFKSSSWGFGNYGDWVNPELDELLKDSWEILDPEVWLPMYDRAQEIIDGEVPSIPICQPNLLVVMRDDIEGYGKMWDTLPRYHRLYRVEK